MGMGISGGAANLGSIDDLKAIAGTEPIDATTDVSGSADAAELQTGAFRSNVDVYFSTTTGADTINVQVSNDGITWRTIEQMAVADGGESDMGQFNLSWGYVRAYAGGGFADGDVDEVTVSAKGL